MSLATADEPVAAGEGLTTVCEAAAYLRLSRARLYELMDQGELQYVKIGRARRIEWRAVRDLVQRSLVSR